MTMRVYILVLTLFMSASSWAMTLNGAGATFPYPIYSKWISEYEKVESNVRINYQSIGSGGGVRQMINQTVDFGASDDPLSDQELENASNRGQNLIHIPTVIGAVTIAYNLEESNGTLKLDGETLAAIYQRRITNWNDPKLKKLNPKLNLPDRDIMVVRRADGSGTTAVFSDYLSKVSDSWRESPGHGKSLRWPAGTIGARGNEGVTAMVAQNIGAIGYIELAYAIQNNLPTALIKNAAGQFQAPTVEAMSLSAHEGLDFDGDLRLSIVNSPKRDAYPISAFTYVLIPDNINTDRQLAVRNFLLWAIQDGQKFAGDLHYAPLPEALQRILTQRLNAISEES